MKRINVALAFMLLSFGSINAFAQTTQASILGRIVNQSNAPQIKSKVKIVNESTGFTSETLTNSNGEYIFKEIPLGGPYRVIVDGQEKKEGYNVNFGDQLTVNINLTDSNEKNIKEVVITGNLKNKIGNLGAATAITAKNISILPVNGRNFTNLTELSPLSGKNGNLSGQLGSSTNYTIDGMTAKNPTSAGSTTSRSGAPYSISIEAVREFKITTNQYDVTLGRSGGGTISAVTKSGTNTLTGSVFEYQRAGWLNSGYDIRGNRVKNDFSTYQFGFSLGGPIVKNKLHFFMAWDHQLDSKPLIIADVRSREDELRLNVTNETLNNVLKIGRNAYGVGNTPQFGTFDRTRNSDAGFLRLDWQISPKHLLTLRNNFTYDFNKNGLADNTNINFYESYGNDKNWDNSLLLTLRSNFSPAITNELKFQHLYTFQNSYQNDELGHPVPRGIVERVNSLIEGQKDPLQTNIQFGGHRFGQESFKNNVYQLVNNLYYNTDKVKYTFGVDLMYTRAKSIYGSEVNGRFHFDGIDNFRDMISYRYYREVPLLDDPSVKSSIWNLGFYGQMMAKIATGLNVTAGLRFDYGGYPKTELNQKLFDEMGIRTDNKIKSFVVQPRVQFDWDINENHKDFIKLGGGVFSSDINNYMLINNLYFDGLHSATVDVDPRKIGLKPDFINYRKDYSTVPSLAQYQLPTINYTGKDAKIPIIYKANISYSHFFNERFRVGISGYAAFGRNNYFYYDRNMVDKPFFTLVNEENRGVFVPADKINTTNGNSNWLDGRINKNFGRVMELVSDGKVNQYSVVFDTSYRYYKDGEFTASYTWADIKDNTSYNGNVANSAILSTMVSSDPRDLRMGYSDSQFRHKIVLYGNSPTFAGFTIGIRYSGIGGTRFSMTAGGNINGDFVNSNDLAYVFPNLTASLLSDPNVGKALKNYIQDYNNKIAERNGGINGFYGIWDVRIAKKLKFEKVGNLEFSVDIFNFANLLNKKWGVNESYGNTSLYKITGFDPVAKQFSYALNTKGLPPLSGTPYQIQIGVRYSF
ncbi:TonB-dependent receptor [Elizabethkingia meningoseptica]|uniref:TonB-dependent receptor n=1 Tax=Elizabethkingia meningoseptica TaxID=238 RepID=UPI00036A7C74|nr:carboxypeptidase regulatory-like domain-containing protein [Elizabethkingia meningoseptica]AQX04090.1 TonB-dependent receptor [Elizabethkingia meningoseptica]AQX46131.1 TonB-dependent receptor [Elizabethkingia meningoseptica]KUY15423.1 TonB-dependent receptor [Elizabethkingia meningoseptica]MDE5488900.1 carboxypeptidase regulatory-like domain-containing protein [Elizabethkingia meningoseptica]MVW92821.1 TonB-dependent receptor [Elizabethkingia meningoseptica]